MTTIAGSDLLAPGARFGHWWVPHDLGSDAAIESGVLPDIATAGVVGVRDEGHWQLLLSAARPGQPDIDAESLTSGIGRREAIWGQTRNDCISLFDGWRFRPRSDLNRESEEGWAGNWRAESPNAWIEPHDEASRVEVEFDLAAAWSERGIGEGRDIDLADGWNPQTRTASLPDPIVRGTEVDGAQVNLRRECLVDCSAESLSARVRTCFSIEEHLAFAEIQERWVRPLFEMLSFCFAERVRVTAVTAWVAEHGKRLRLHYPEPLATVPDIEPDGPAQFRSQFVVLGDLVACGTDFETAIPSFLQWYRTGGAAALTLLVDCQRPLLDRSVGSRLLSVAMSLEAHEKTAQGNDGHISVGPAIKTLLARSGPIGDDIKRLWGLRGGKKFHKSLPALRAKHAAHGHSGHERFASVEELLDLERHVTALQWLLRWRYLQYFGVSESDATRLVTESRGYQGMLHVAEEQFGYS